MPSDISVFLREALKNPLEVRAVAPSSAAVARLMTEGLEQAKGPIVEIGPGTGSFTREILSRGIAPERLTLMELNPRFCEELQRKFPGVTVLNRPAEEIEETGLTNVGYIVSGVPVLAQPELQRAVVGSALRVMAPDAVFAQITYSPSSPVPPALQTELGITARKRGTVWAN
jgi:phosphatidylethanolamine/phosphatidyl-N-methylethanolamine N-methyltransferase